MQFRFTDHDYVVFILPWPLSHSVRNTQKTLKLTVLFLVFFSPSSSCSTTYSNNQVILYNLNSACVFIRMPFSASRKLDENRFVMKEVIRIFVLKSGVDRWDFDQKPQSFLSWPMRFQRVFTSSSRSVVHSLQHALSESNNTHCNYNWKIVN